MNLNARPPSLLVILIVAASSVSLFVDFSGAMSAANLPRLARGTMSPRSNILAHRGPPFSSPPAASPPVAHAQPLSHQCLDISPREETTTSSTTPSKALAYGLGIGLPVSLGVLAILLLFIYKLHARLQGTQAALAQAQQRLSPVGHGRAVSLENGSETGLVQEPRAAMPGTMTGAGAVITRQELKKKGKCVRLGQWNEMSYVDPYRHQDVDPYAY